MKKILFIFLNFLAFKAFAINIDTSPGTLGGILEEVWNILNTVLPIIMVLATLLFIWGLVWYLTSTGKEDKQKEARNLMIWGVIILFAMVAVWGLVTIIESTFDIDEDTKIPREPGDISF